MPYLREGLVQHLRTALSVSAGYTIIEVLFVLTISSIIFIAAMSLFGGQTSETQFSATMQDVNSEITAKLKEVSTNLSGAYQQYTCNVNPDPVSGRMQAVLSSGGPSTNNDCLYLGKALFTPKDSSDIYIYTVLGNRQTYQSTTPSGLAISLKDTNPVPATSPDLTEKYTIRGAKVTSSQINNDADPTKYYYLIGYFTDLQGGSANSPDSNPHLLSEGYNIGTGPVNDLDVYSCIIRTDNLAPGVCSPSPQDVTVWTLCLADTGGNRRARLDINNSSSGITTNLQFNVNCP